MSQLSPPTIKLNKFSVSKQAYQIRKQKLVGSPLHLLLPKKSIRVSYGPSRANQGINLRLFVPLRPLLLLSDERSSEILRHVGHNCKKEEDKSINTGWLFLSLSLSLSMHHKTIELTSVKDALRVFRLEGNHSSQSFIKIVFEMSQNG